VNSAFNLTTTPEHDNMILLLGWRQWADAGAMSSGLPKYLAQENNAKKIGTMKPDGFYLFQMPGLYDLARPVIEFENGFPVKLDTPRNDLYYAEVGEHGVLFFIGDEPNMDVERYVSAILDLVRDLNVKQVISFGGVFAEVPYNKARFVSSTYSLRRLHEPLKELNVNFSDYHGGASINSVLCKRASEHDIAYTSFYAFIPTYDLSKFESLENMIQIENDFKAWVEVMRRVNHYLNIKFDLAELERKTSELMILLDEKIQTLDRLTDSDVKAYFRSLAEDFEEEPFDPLADVWEQALKGLLDDEDSDNSN